MGVLKVRPDGDAVLLLSGAQFADAYRLVVDEPEIDALAAARRALARAPRWVTALMGLRTVVVAPFGLKGGRRRGQGGSGDGAAVGVFPIISRAPARVVLGFDDKHLDFRIVVDLSAVDARRRQITMTTLVRTHNPFGRAYLAAVLPFHRTIVPTLLAQAARG
jgi:hypothetical protein